MEDVVYVGVDPGKNGGLAAIDGEKNVFAVFPFSDDFSDVLRELFATWYKDGKVVVAAIEKVHSMPKQGVVSTFNFGYNYGYIKGCFDILAIPVSDVSPQKWKREFKLSSDKKLSIELAQHLYPGVNLLATERSKKPHDGMAEALLIAEYLRRESFKGEE